MIAEPEHVHIADEIPALIWSGRGPGPHAAIVTVHGGGGSKSDVDPQTVERVTSGGVILVSIDAYLHGEHIPADFDRRALGSGCLAILLEIYAHTARDLFNVVSYLHQDLAVEEDRIGLRGGSMGAYIILVAMGMGIPVRAALSVCGAADYATTFVNRLRRQNRTSEEIEGEMEAVQEQIPTLDPLFHVDRFPPRAIMMIHGTEDPLVPIAAHRALYDALVPYYREHPQDCLFVTHAGGHETPSSIEEMGWSWLAQQLGSTAPT